MMPMNQAEADPEKAETPEEDASEQTPHVKFCFTALGDDKFMVYKDLPEDEEKPGVEEMQETYDGLESALKALVKLVKANPVGGDEGTGFHAGYSAEQGGGY